MSQKNKNELMLALQLPLPDNFDAALSDTVAPWVMLIKQNN